MLRLSGHTTYFHMIFGTESIPPVDQPQPHSAGGGRWFNRVLASTVPANAMRVSSAEMVSKSSSRKLRRSGLKPYVCSSEARLYVMGRAWSAAQRAVCPGRGIGQERRNPSKRMKPNSTPLVIDTCLGSKKKKKKGPKSQKVLLWGGPFYGGGSW
jgi:hypothetical protein